MSGFNGLGTGLGQLFRVSAARTRSISAENPTGGKGQGGMSIDGVAAIHASELGQGWKVNPYIVIAGGSTATLADIAGPGAIQHLWMTTAEQHWRRLVLRAYWDGESEPSVEVPYGDFFCNGWTQYCAVSSLPVAATSVGGFNSYWEMPFRSGARWTIENLGSEPVLFFYQITYALTDIPDDAAYFHACWNRSRPLPSKQVHLLADHIRGKGHYVGTYVAWEAKREKWWWGEGEVKFYLDGDEQFPTICGTGTEDYFGGAWGFKARKQPYAPYSTAYLGFPQAIVEEYGGRTVQRFGMYRWHIPDPIRFETDMRVSIQALGWGDRADDGYRRYVTLEDDIASTCFWYQLEPHVAHPASMKPEQLAVD